MTSTFTIVIRGYDRAQVDRLLGRADAALASGDDALRASARDLLRGANITVVLRGYARAEVDDAVADRLRRLEPTTGDTAPHDPVPATFVVTMRGYDMAQVDDLFTRVDAALRSGSDFTRASARDALRATRFRVRIRGYARTDVDRAVREALRRLA